MLSQIKTTGPGSCWCAAAVGVVTTVGEDEVAYHAWFALLVVVQVHAGRRLLPE
jgi:hypothetical protein